MNKQQSIFIIISILVIINLTSIWLFYNQNTQDRTRGPRNMIVKVLQLDEQQITDYDKLITEHKEAFRVANLNIDRVTKVVEKNGILPVSAEIPAVLPQQAGPHRLPRRQGRARSARAAHRLPR